MKQYEVLERFRLRVGTIQLSEDIALGRRHVLTATGDPDTYTINGEVVLYPGMTFGYAGDGLAEHKVRCLTPEPEAEPSSPFGDDALGHLIKLAAVNATAASLADLENQPHSPPISDEELEAAALAAKQELDQAQQSTSNPDQTTSQEGDAPQGEPPANPTDDETAGEAVDPEKVLGDDDGLVD